MSRGQYVESTKVGVRIDRGLAQRADAVATKGFDGFTSRASVVEEALRRYLPALEAACGIRPTPAPHDTEEATA